jgi:iron(III) transport system ATP-binding protein
MVDLAISDLALRGGGADIVKGVSVNVPAGKVVALLGPSDSGNTSILRSVAGFETPHRGSIRIGEHVLFDASRHISLPAEARRLGLVSQSYALWPHRSVFDTVAYGLKLRRVKPGEIKTRVDRALAQIGLAELAGNYPHQLSSPEQQRVALARALVYEPAAILLEEPLSNLDARLRDEARAWLRHLIVSLNLPALLVTPDQLEAMAMADRIALLNGGLIEQEGAPIDLYREPATLFAAEFMGNNNRLLGTLVENADTRAAIEVKGVRLEGVPRTRGAVGEKATGLIRLEKVLLGGGPGSNRILMTLKTQMYVGERWELLFAKDDLSVRAYAAAPLKHEIYHVEFPPQALWIF